MTDHRAGYPITRAKWRELPFRFVVVPVMDGPVLVFADHMQAQAEVWRSEIEEQAARWRSSADPIRRKRIAIRIRLLHVARVNAAEAFSWPSLLPHGVLFDDE